MEQKNTGETMLIPAASISAYIKARFNTGKPVKYGTR